MSRFIMAAIAIVFFTAAIVSATSIAATPRCDVSQTFDVNITTGDYGCIGAYGGVTVKWVMSTDSARLVTYSLTGYQDSRVTFTQDGVTVYTDTPNDAGTLFFEKGKQLTVIYFSGGSYQTQYGLTFTLAPGPDVNTLVSSQTTTLSKEQQGGFVYFNLPHQSQGRQFALDVEVFSYQGLQEPSVFVNRNTIPTLEKYDYTNTTVSSGAGRETCLLFINNPPAASYLVGVFLYGSAASLSVKASWQYNMNFLVSGVKVSKTTTTVEYYQVYVPVGSAKLVFQISRQVPGGFPIAYIAQGVVPTETQYTWKADTRTQSYISISIPNPNPSGQQGSNPGNYIFAIASASGSAGFIIQADWS